MFKEVHTLMNHLKLIPVMLGSFTGDKIKEFNIE